jgi:acyl phosphate:glycerol-3-phosphate acyltransferase
MRDLAIIAAVSYLLGSIPFGYLLVRIFHGEDVRQTGSGNIGATNVSRKSPVLGVLTLLLDALKGTCAVWLAHEIFARTPHGYGSPRLYPMMAVAGVFAVLGHMFPVWLRFRGGKGVATSLGAFAPITPHAIFWAIAVFLVVTLIFRYVSLGSVVASATFPMFAWLSFRGHCEHPVRRVFPMALVACLIIAKHRQNIRRLLAGTESRFGSKRAEGSQ